MMMNRYAGDTVDFLY